MVSKLTLKTKKMLGKRSNKKPSKLSAGQTAYLAERLKMAKEKERVKEKRRKQRIEYRKKVGRARARARDPKAWIGNLKKGKKKLHSFNVKRRKARKHKAKITLN